MVWEGAWNTDDPPGRQFIVSRALAGFVSRCGAGTPPPGWVSSAWSGSAERETGRRRPPLPYWAVPEALFYRCMPEAWALARSPALGVAEAWRVLESALEWLRGWAKPTGPKCFICARIAHIS